MVKLGIVGLGGWGRRVVGAVQNRSSLAQFSRAATRTPSKVEDFAAEQGLALSDRIESVLDDPAIDAVVVAGPAPLHAELALRTLAAGKHTMVIKPLALCRRDAEALREAAESGGLVLALGYDRCFLPAADELRRRIADGALGQIVHAAGDFCADRYFNVAAGDWKSEDVNAPPGSLADHMLYTMIELLGPVEALSVQARRFAAPTDISDTATVTMQFAGGATGVLTAIGITPPFERLHFFGTEGWAEIRNNTRLEIRPLKGDSTVIDFPASDLVALQMEAFARAVAGEKPYPVTPDAAVAGAAALEAMLRATKSGKTERV